MELALEISLYCFCGDDGQILLRGLKGRGPFREEGSEPRICASGRGSYIGKRSGDRLQDDLA